MTHLIRKATKADLSAFELWLRKEREEGGEGLYVNWSVVEDIFHDGGMAVLVVDSYPLAFIAKRIGRTGILEVHPDQRGKGYGRLLAQW